MRLRWEDLSAGTRWDMPEASMSMPTAMMIRPISDAPSSRCLSRWLPWPLPMLPQAQGPDMYALIIMHSVHWPEVGVMQQPLKPRLPDVLLLYRNQWQQNTVPGLERLNH